MGRVVGRGLQQRTPAYTGVADDRQVERLRDGEDVRFRASMGGIVADHQAVDAAGLGQFCGEIAVVGGDADSADGGGAFHVVQQRHRAVLGENGLPFVFAAKVVERQRIEIVGLQLGEVTLDLSLGLVGGAGVKLGGNDHLLAARAKLADGRAHAVRVSAPVEVVDPTVNGVEYVLRVEVRVAARGQAKPANAAQ